MRFFAIVYNVEIAPELKYNFPFDKQLNIKSDTIILTSTPYEFGGSPNIHGKTYDLLSSENKYLNVGDKKYQYQLNTFEISTESKHNLTRQEKDSILTEVQHEIEKQKKGPDNRNKPLSRLITIVILCFSVLKLYGQTKDSTTALGDRLGDSLIICNTTRELIEPFETGDELKADTLDCFIRVTYQTDTPEVFYIKDLYLNGNVKEEGLAKPEWYSRRFLFLRLKPKDFTLVKHGKWRFYDLQGNITSNCGYTDGQIWSGCKWSEFDGSGTRQTEYYIDH